MKAGPPLNDTTLSRLEVPGGAGTLPVAPHAPRFRPPGLRTPPHRPSRRGRPLPQPRSITTAVNPRSAGGPHDFSSEGDYWWPDPANPAGPYISRDGLTNPDNFVAHRQLLLGFVRDFGALAAAYRVSGDERFAAAAVRHAHVWFVDPATRMNPSLPYSQVVKGRNSGRSYVFGALATGRRDWLELWQKLDPDPKVEAIRRNFPIRNPVRWVR